MPDGEQEELLKASDGDAAADSTPSEEPLDPSLAEAILDLVTEGGVANSDSAVHASSVALLAPGAMLAVRLIVSHGKHCHRPKTCLDTPPPLRNLLTMRRAAVERQLDSIARALLQFPQFTLVQHTREDWLKRLSDVPNGDLRVGLIQAIEDGEVFSREGLIRYLGEEPAEKACLLGTTLWARGLSEPRASALFRLLGPVATVNDRMAPPALETPQPGKQRDRASRREERREVQALQNELKEAKRARRRIAEDLADEIRLRENAVAALDDANAERETQKTGIETMQRELRVAQGRVTTLERDIARGSNANQKLREAMEAAEGARKELEQARNRAVRELSIKNRQIDVLRAEIAALPAGADAVHVFLEAEEARIDQDLLILQGADRARADDEHAAHRKLEQAFRQAYPSYIPPRPASLAKREDLELELLGGGDEVGRSAYTLRIGEYTVLVDCGIKIGRKHLDEAIPNVAALDRLDAVVLTHAHTDHLGWLPAIVRAFPEVSIYCTTETAEIAPIMLDDCYRHHAVNMHKLRVEREHSTDPTPIPETYEREDVAEVEFHLIGCDFGEPVTLPSSEIQLRFLRAGHILGAASALIEGGNRRVLMSGDISSEAQLTVGTADWTLAGDGKLDLLVLESTYGDVSREPLSQAQEQLIEFLSRVVSDGGSVILPCFGLGRGQEVAMVLAQAMDAGHLPRVPVWIDGMIRSINSVYRDYQPQFQLPANFVEVQASLERSEVVDQARREPVLIVTTSGMLAGGPAVEYAQKLLPDAQHRIAFTGYQDEGNPGHELLRLTDGGTGSRTVTVAGEEGQAVEIRAAAPARKYGLSAHADQAGLLRYAATLQPRHIALVHGFARTQEPLQARLKGILPNAEVALGSARRLPVP